MSKFKNIFSVMSTGLFIVMLLTSCLAPKKVAPLPPQPICSEALEEGLSSLTNNQLSALLEEAEDQNRLEDCWIPLVKGCLDENRDISREHLVKAVKTFNQQQYEPYFHKSLYRYFADITKNPSEYRPADRKLLELYCSYLINNARSHRDTNLRQTKLLCRKLDRNLYARIFE